LSGYEEPALEDDVTHTDTSSTLESSEGHDAPQAGAAAEGEDGDSFVVDSPTQVTGVQSTPKLSASTKSTNGVGRAGMPHAESYRSPSPRKYTGTNPLGPDMAAEEPSTPRPHAMSNEQSSPFQPESAFQPSALRLNNDPLMHRVLDRNYRIQATPHTQRRQQQAQAKPTPVANPTKTLPWDDSPDSSPEMAAPQLRSELFSPAKPPRTPGVSVLAPGRGKVGRVAPTTSTGRQLFSPQDKAYLASKDRTPHIFANDDSDDEFEMSLPKTMQFHLPQSRLVQTPAREASRMIVENLLLTAGADVTDDIEADGHGMQEASPSVVRRAFDDDDDTF
jgi:DASH complex subunit ASK1